MKVLFEDRDLLVVSKPAGLVVDGGEREDSFELLVRAHAGPGVFPFHRIDRATSGIVLYGKTKVHAAAITQGFEKKQIRKAYLAVVEGDWKPEWNRVESDVDGKTALTTYRLMGRAANFSLIEALPKTGRKHQIRIHCKEKGCPIVGDTLHGASGGEPGVPPLEQALHAYKLSFKHPGTGDAISILDIPEHWRETYLAGFEWDAITSRLKR